MPGALDAGRGLSAPADGSALARGFVLWVGAEGGGAYGDNIVPVAEVRCAREFWEAWDSAAAPLIKLACVDGLRVVAPRGAVRAVAVHDARGRPEWECPTHGGRLLVAPREPAGLAGVAAECALFVIGDACPQARRCAGVRVARGGAGDARCEVWLLSEECCIVDTQGAGGAEGVRQCLAAYLAQRGAGADVTVAAP